jgi:hypothetical protein
MRLLLMCSIILLGGCCNRTTTVPTKHDTERCIRFDTRGTAGPNTCASVNEDISTRIHIRKGIK